MHTHRFQYEAEALPRDSPPWLRWMRRDSRTSQNRKTWGEKKSMRNLSGNTRGLLFFSLCSRVGVHVMVLALQIKSTLSK